jgi:hypothetical protein
MTSQEAAAAARKFAPEGGAIDASRARETREGWYFPYRWDGEPRIGSNGVIVNKASGACLVLGSAFEVDRDLVAYDEGFQFERYDLTITSIRDEGRTLDAIEELGISVVTPEIEHGMEWRIPRRLTRDELRSQLSRLPHTFPDLPLYFRVEVLQEARRNATFAYTFTRHTPEKAVQPGIAADGAAPRR